MNVCSFLVALAATLTALAATPTSPARAQEIVRFGVQPALQPIYIAKALGFIDQIQKKHDVKFEWPNFNYGAPQNQAFGAGALEFSSAGMGPAVIAAARLPGHLIAIDVLEQTAIIIPEDSTATTIADLKGKTIAFPGEGSQQYPLLLKALADAGMKETDIKLFKANAPNIGQLVIQKDVDAGIIWDPHVSNALASGKSKILLQAAAIMPIKEGNYVGNGTYVRTDFMEKRPELVQDVVNAIVASIDIITADPDKAAEIWSKEIGTPVEVINYSLRERVSVYNRNVIPDRDTIEAYTRFMKHAGILQESDNVSVETRFAERAITADNSFATPQR